MRKKMQSWKVLAAKEVFQAKPWITVSVQRIGLPDGRVVEDYYQIKLREFVLIVMLTDDHRVLMLRHYRHGIGQECLGLPAGTLEAGESALQTAQRELREETGWEADTWRSLGSFIPHSNYGCGQGHFFLATRCRQVAAPDSDDLEESELVLLDKAECLKGIREGRIRSLSVVAALLLAFESVASDSV